MRGIFRRARRVRWMEIIGHRKEHLAQYRKFRTVGRLCIFLAVFGILFYIKSGSQTFEDPYNIVPLGASRHLLAVNVTNDTHGHDSGHGPVWERCDFEKSSSSAGWAVAHTCFILTLFIAIAVICDDFFVPSLEAISEKLRLSEDVAGATFMAAGSSAPELFTSVAGVAVQTDVGVGTIVGSAVFNILVIIALTAALCGQVLHLDWRPMARDSFFYALSICCFIVFSWDGKFELWESIVLLVLYVLYILLMVINPRLMKFMGTWKCCFNAAVEPLESDSPSPDSSNEQTNTTVVETGDKNSKVKLEGRKPSLTGGHARRLSILSQRSASDTNNEEKHIFHHVHRGSVVGVLSSARLPPKNLEFNHKDSGFQSHENSTYSRSTDISHMDMKSADTDISYINEENHKLPADQRKNAKLKNGPFHQQGDSKSALKRRFSVDSHRRHGAGDQEQTQHANGGKITRSLSLSSTQAHEKFPKNKRTSLPPLNDPMDIENGEAIQLQPKNSALPPIQKRRSYAATNSPSKQGLLNRSYEEEESDSTQDSSKEKKEVGQSETNLSSPAGPAENNVQQANNSSSISEVPNNHTCTAKSPVNNNEPSLSDGVNNALESQQINHHHESSLYKMSTQKEPGISTVEEEDSKDGDEEDEEEGIKCGCCPTIKASPPDRKESGDGCCGTFKFVVKWILFVLSFPFILMFSWTIPDLSKEHLKKWYIVSFIVSVLWIAVLSFAIVTLVARTGCIIGIDSYTMGLVVIAIGTSIPDALSSILVARDGYGDMAVSNAIGSNVFDIDLGIGFPFVIRSLIDKGKAITLMDSEETALWMAGALPYGNIVPHVKFGFILLMILFIAITIFIVARFRLNKYIGISFSLIYVLFLVYAFVQEAYCNKVC